MGNIFNDLVSNFDIRVTTFPPLGTTKPMIGANPSRILFQVTNSGTNPLWVGFDSAISTSRYNFQIVSGSDLILLWKDWGNIMQRPIYCFTNFAGTPVTITEVFWLDIRKENVQI